ncbi:MAG: phenylacetate-CoA oxygenase subunit PaaJ [Intrasporangium sp.]|uniref:1,2-phenylacetyl-CoA epoxidase subunit PaaD n=1 Tax=Intrasporangium sp. TaxID=1925024 RepID=UPI0026492E89|nr:1,2-phenylacetyl-CoA epoxidase subunit PaaD [Intrasporangium sp.]MDN5794239.1 phenylacetate-CoA oxygenase subunit PaaJ [Intrasporangium sp.]
MAVDSGTKHAVVQAISAIPDPEIPVISIADLGILREVVLDEDARTVTVTITPTYSGCPAMELIRSRIEHEASVRGLAVEVRTQLSPAWTTDWMTEQGKEALHRFGIAPPGPVRAAGPVPLQLRRHVVVCPHCGSDDTTEIAHFGSTACKALRRCNACREPFDEFKAM